MTLSPYCLGKPDLASIERTPLPIQSVAGSLHQVGFHLPGHNLLLLRRPLPSSPMTDARRARQLVSMAASIRNTSRTFGTWARILGPRPANGVALTIVRDQNAGCRHRRNRLDTSYIKQPALARLALDPSSHGDRFKRLTSRRPHSCLGATPFEFVVRVACSPIGKIVTWLPTAELGQRWRRRRYDSDWLAFVCPD